MELWGPHGNKVSYSGDPRRKLLVSTVIGHGYYRDQKVYPSQDPLPKGQKLAQPPGHLGHCPQVSLPWQRLSSCFIPRSEVLQV